MSDLLPSMTTAAGPHAAANPFGSFLFLGAFVVLVYFMLWRPQNKRQKEHRQVLENLKKGDEIVTNGGIVGRIAKITENFVVMSVSGAVELHLQKQAISSVLPKGTIKAIEK